MFYLQWFLHASFKLCGMKNNGNTFKNVVVSFMYIYVVKTSIALSVDSSLYTSAGKAFFALEVINFAMWVLWDVMDVFGYDCEYMKKFG